MIPPKKGRETVLLMDTTYFGSTFGIMLFKDAYTEENLYKTYVNTETNKEYLNGIYQLIENAFIVMGIVCD